LRPHPPFRRGFGRALATSRWAAGGALVAVAPVAAAAEPLPRWELGAFAFAVSQQAYPGADQNVARALALPFALYRGPILRVDQSTVGVRAVRTPRFEFDIGFAGAFGSASSEIEARRGMPNLGTLVEFGPRLKWNAHVADDGTRWRVDLPLRGVFDLNDRLASRGLSFEPELQIDRRSASGWRTTASLGAVIGNERLADVFYQVDPAFATATRPAYDARAGLIAWRLGLSASVPLGADWRLVGFTRLDSVAGAANRASPLVRQTTGLTAGVGIAWTALRSSRPGAD
jgi:outer membrane scaffolding protein for murein synthesis (MipA/OmpV family)